MSPEESCPLFDTAGVTYAISIMGHPAICISCGLDEYGMPFGLQVIGLRSANSLMLDAAMALEKLFRDLPGFGRPPAGSHPAGGGEPGGDPALPHAGRPMTRPKAATSYKPPSGG